MKWNHKFYQWGNRMAYLGFQGRLTNRFRFGRGRVNLASTKLTRALCEGGMKTVKGEGEMRVNCLSRFHFP